MASIWVSATNSDPTRGIARRSPPGLLRQWVGSGVFAGLVLVFLTGATRIYQTPEAFISESFGGNQPAAGALWLTGPSGEAAAAILGHRAPPRVPYWQAGSRTAFVLEEIGKEQPITAGIVVEAGRIEQVRVLVYRESRGGEVRHPAFTRQFEGAGLKEDMRLNQSIDGISGATLSVNALNRMARLALFLDRQLRTDTPTAP